jgi:uncharacterized protein DUF4154
MLALRLAAAWSCLALCATAAHAQQASEATVKAAFLYKFAGYVEWPATALPAPETAVTIAVAGNNEVAEELEKLVPGRKVNGRPVLVRRLRSGEDPRGAHVVFVGRGETNPGVLARAAQQAGALVVAEGERGLEQGAAINFVPMEDRIGFDVSLEAAEKAGVRISSRMLGVARKVVSR